MSSPAIANSNHRPKPLTASSRLNVLMCLNLREWKRRGKVLSRCCSSRLPAETCRVSGLDVCSRRYPRAGRGRVGNRRTQPGAGQRPHMVSWGRQGPTGQQVWVRGQYAQENAGVKNAMPKTASQVAHPQRVTRSTSGLHRDPSVVPPGHCRRGTQRMRQARAGRRCLERRMQRAAAPSQALHSQKVTRPA
jgi:hypothetical protein